MRPIEGSLPSSTSSSCSVRRRASQTSSACRQSISVSRPGACASIDVQQHAFGRERKAPFSGKRIAEAGKGPFLPAAHAGQHRRFFACLHTAAREFPEKRCCLFGGARRVTTTLRLHAPQRPRQEKIFALAKALCLWAQCVQCAGRCRCGCLNTPKYPLPQKPQGCSYPRSNGCRLPMSSIPPLQSLLTTSGKGERNTCTAYLTNHKRASFYSDERLSLFCKA